MANKNNQPLKYGDTKMLYPTTKAGILSTGAQD